MEHHENIGPNMNISPGNMGPTNVSPANIGPNMAPTNMMPMNVGPACTPPPMPCGPWGPMGPNMMPKNMSPTNIDPMAHKKMMYDLCKQHLGKTVKVKTIFGDEFTAKIDHVDAENVYFILVNTDMGDDDDRGWGWGWGGRFFWPLLWIGGLGGWWW